MTPESEVERLRRALHEIAHTSDYAARIRLEKAALTYHDAPAPPVRCAICNAPDGAHPLVEVGGKPARRMCDGSVAEGI